MFYKALIMEVSSSGYDMWGLGVELIIFSNEHDMIGCWDDVGNCY